MTDITITNNTASHRYEATIGGELAGYCEYSELRNGLLLSHTEVLPAHEGQGVGSALARHVLDEVRAQGRLVIPACLFMAGYIRKHREYADLVSEDSKRAFNI